MAEYIEREKAEKVASKYGCTSGETLGTHSGLADCIAYEIAKIPAADVALVRHGRRLSPSECNGNAFETCSLCGAWYDVLQGTDDGDLLYCPHLSARLFGKTILPMA